MFDVNHKINLYFSTGHRVFAYISSLWSLFDIFLVHVGRSIKRLQNLWQIQKNIPTCFQTGNLPWLLKFI
ncbi:hypothetical protein M758_9G127200 [Ceratodon purpureus]|nr:hypothetical protein M758_9G127200 [Ceratodon purpureus]